MTREKLVDLSGYLYEGGWRSSDGPELMQEYGLAFYDAAIICESLADLESAVVLPRRNKTTREELQDLSGCLYEGGWRSSDGPELMQEYGLGLDAVTIICEELAALAVKNLV